MGTEAAERERMRRGLGTSPLPVSTGLHRGATMGGWEIEDRVEERSPEDRADLRTTQQGSLPEGRERRSRT
jgi:hypothetical protein